MDSLKENIDYNKPGTKAQRKDGELDMGYG